MITYFNFDVIIYIYKKNNNFNYYGFVQKPLTRENLKYSSIPPLFKLSFSILDEI